MASREQWYWKNDEDGEAQGPYLTRLAAVAACLETQKGSAIYDDMIDGFVELLENFGYTIGRLMPPKTLS